MKKFLFIGLLFLVYCLSACAQQPDIKVDDFEKAITTKKVQLLDVRTAGEYESGHLEHAFLADWTNREQFKSRVSALDKSTPVYVYCLSGGRSADAVEWLRAKGYTAYNMEGGIAAWKQAGKKVEQQTAVAQMTIADYRQSIPANKTVLVDFGAVWCPPCKKMEPVLDSLVKQYGDAFQLVKIDGGQQSSICNDLKISGFPTFIVYRQGKETWRAEGIVEKPALVAALGLGK